VVLNPALKDSREGVLEALFIAAGLTDETRNLLRLLAERDRIGILDALVVEVESIADDRAGRRRAYVAAPVKLAAAQVKRIGAALEARFNCPVTVTTEVDPDMLGGLVCRVGDLTLDYSVRRQLEILRENLEAEAI
jgi:F-type H+-transporting ATPase subunit delta